MGIAEDKHANKIRGAPNHGKEYTQVQVVDLEREILQKWKKNPNPQTTKKQLKSQRLLEVSFLQPSGIARALTGRICIYWEVQVDTYQPG